MDKIVFSSTAVTYGEPESIPILETDKTGPTNTDGETKLSMEKMMKWTGRAGDHSTLTASSEKAREVLGWHPEYDRLEEIIENVWKWDKNHPHGYAK